MSLVLIIIPESSTAQPFKFKTKEGVNPIALQLSWHNEGKGAAILYNGKNEPVMLKVKSYQKDTSDSAVGAQSEERFIWEEITKGRATGEFSVKMRDSTLYDMSYIRYSDRKKTDFDYIPDTTKYNVKSVAILHGVQFEFFSFYKQDLTLSYEDGESRRITLEECPEDKPRYCEIADFNFDGIDDIGFVFTDETGLNLIYNIFIYNPLSKKFAPLILPDLEEDKFRILNPKFNATDKSLTVSYKSGPSWNSYLYKFGKNDQLKFFGKL